MMSLEIWTLGHSNHSLEAFLAIVQVASIRLIADVRRFPGSRRHPHFNADPLQEALAANQIAYRNFAGLGGRRKERAPGSPNNGWRVEAFNAFADHMITTEFLGTLQDLSQLAADSPTAIMCSEALPWQCHRRLISDALVARGWSVQDVFPSGKVVPHVLTDFARVSGQTVTYPAQPLLEI